MNLKALQRTPTFFQVYGIDYSANKVFTCKEENTRNEKNVGLIVDPHIPKPKDWAQAYFGCLW
jgi:hypothetical protein